MADLGEVASSTRSQEAVSQSQASFIHASAHGTQGLSWEQLLANLDQFAQVIGAAESTGVAAWQPPQVADALTWATYAHQVSSLVVSAADVRDVDEGLREHHEQLRRLGSLPLSRKPLSIRLLRTSAHTTLLRAILLNRSTPPALLRTTLRHALRLPRGAFGVMARERGDAHASSAQTQQRGSQEPARASAARSEQDAAADSTALVARALLPALQAACKLRLAQSVLEQMVPHLSRQRRLQRAQHVRAGRFSAERFMDTRPTFRRRDTADASALAAALCDSALPSSIVPTGVEAGLSPLALARLLQRRWSEAEAAASAAAAPGDGDEGLRRVEHGCYSAECCVGYFTESRCCSAVHAEAACWLLVGCRLQVKAPLAQTALQRAAMKVVRKMAVGKADVLFALHPELLAVVCNVEICSVSSAAGVADTDVAGVLGASLADLYGDHLHGRLLRSMQPTSAQAAGLRAHYDAYSLLEPEIDELVDITHFDDVCNRFSVLVAHSLQLKVAVTRRFIQNVSACTELERVQLVRLVRRNPFMPSIC
mmetsp:Transcript_33121/g.69696  ORF Transcript_33121/g.69696 Transcript_33121/m.69696 type:complete len:540 (-) Transcript_33121:142-1761(-)